MSISLLCITDRHAVSAVFDSRLDRPGFSQLKKEIRRGKSQKCKSQGWRGGSAFGWQTAGLSSGILLEIGSSLVVDRHQKWTKSRIVARQGGFFFGFAEQKPNVLGGKCSWGSRWLRIFGF
jgi:hypothetical protein